MPTTPKPHLSPVDLTGLTPDQRLEALFAHGCTYDLMAQIDGVSRGTISHRIIEGRAKGLNLPSRQKAGPPPPRAADRLPPAPPTLVFSPEPLAFVDELPTRREPMTCQWVVGTLRDCGRVVYCDEPTERRRSFCPYHHQLCTVPKQEAKEAPAVDRVPAPRFGSLGWGGPR